MNFELKKEDWGKFFDNLSKRRYEWITEVEIIGTGLGDQVLSNGLPLNGITVETVRDHPSIDVSVGETVSDHQTHTIRDPTRVAFLAGDGVHHDVVNIEEADGTKTLVRLIKPMGILVGMTEFQMVSTSAGGNSIESSFIGTQDFLIEQEIPENADTNCN